jgi:hypothetical protein
MKFVKGMIVNVPAPTSKDLWQHEFTGTVCDFHVPFVTVRDQDGDCFDVEPDRLTVA